MDWRTKALILTSIQIIILRLRVIGMFMFYIVMKKRASEFRKRKRGYSYSMLDKLPKQIEHMHDLVHINDDDCVNLLRMDRNAFHRLCYVLEHRGGLTSCRYVNVQEQTAIFLQTLAHHHKNRVVKFDFKRSGQTISHYYNKTLEALCKIHELIFVKPKPIDQTCTDERWKPFQGCLGALDGTYVKLRVPIKDKTRYRSRKGIICTNVLGVCDPNLNFIYVLAGWEGSVGDARVLRECISRPTGLRVPTGTYYLCDQGYKNAEGFLTPFRNRRYHLEEWGEGGNRPANAPEYFNMKHSKARNVIERAFGLLKIRFPILTTTSRYSVLVQNRNIMACVLLHNWIRTNMAVDPLEADGTQIPPEPRDDFEYIDEVDESREWHDWRGTMAAEMYANRRTSRN